MTSYKKTGKNLQKTKKKQIKRVKKLDSPLLFLCHSTKDKKFVRKLANHLTILGINVWFDEWELSPGDSLHNIIGKAISKAAYLTVVISPDSLNSLWCQSELNNALGLEKTIDRTFVIPIIYRKAEIPTFLLDKFHINFSQKYFRSLTKLAGSILGLNNRLLDMEMLKSPPKSLSSTIHVIHECGGQGMIKFPPNTTKEIKKLLSEHGYKLGNTWGIMTDLQKEVHSIEIAKC